MNTLDITDTALVIGSELMRQGYAKHLNPELRSQIEEAATAYDAAYDSLSQKEQDGNDRPFDLEFVPVLMDYFPVGSEIKQAEVNHKLFELVTGKTWGKDTLEGLRHYHEADETVVCELGDKDSCFIAIVKEEVYGNHQVLRYVKIDDRWIADTLCGGGATADNVLCEMDYYLSQIV